MAIPRLAQKVLLVGWDAADWQIISPLIDSGAMPALARLVERGVMGNIATLQPCLSPLLWTSIATGKLADKHGILGFIEPDGSGGVRLATSTTRKTKALWNILAQNGLRTNVVSWYASHPAEPINGVCVSNIFDQDPPAPGQMWPLPPEAVHPHDWAERVTALRVHPQALKVSDLQYFIPRLSDINPKKDHRPQELIKALAHCSSVHAVATELLAGAPWDLTAVYYDTLDVAGHVFMPYHPPKMHHVSDRDFRLYRDVMVRLYQFHDRLLARLIELAGDDATVILVSDHGFHSAHGRPRTTHVGDSPEALAAAWHRQFGVFCMAGPAIKHDERVYATTLLDVAPTVLTLLGVPHGKDMDGKPLVQALEQEVPLEPVASWDTIAGDAGMHPPERRVDASASQATLERLVALGYLDASAAKPTAAVQAAEREVRLNLALVYMNSFRPALALPILQELAGQDPENPRYAMTLAWAFSANQKPRECCAVLEALEKRGVSSPDAVALWAGELCKLGQTAAALEHLARAERATPNSMTVLLTLGNIHFSEHQWQDAERVFRRATEVDPDSHQAHYGLSGVRLEQGDYEGAADAVMRALALAHFFPAAHFRLGLALEGLGLTDQAVQSMETAVTMAPGYKPAHRRLAELYRARGDRYQTMRHERLAEGYLDAGEGAIFQ